MGSTYRPLIRHALLYGGVLAILALAAALIDFRLTLGGGPARLSALMLALLFSGLGIWLGLRLSPRRRAAFERNAAGIASLGISARELEVLDRLAEGASTKVIARQLAISPNTVKTHLARLFEKLEATNRTQAIAKARALDILP